MSNVKICYDNLEITQIPNSDSISIWGTVFFCVQDICFPSRDWDDLLDILVPMWIEKTEALITQNKRRCTLNFCDGPFQVDVIRKEADTLELVFIKQSINHSSVQMIACTELNAFLHSLLSLGQAFLDYCCNYACPIYRSTVGQTLKGHCAILRAYLETH